MEEVVMSSRLLTCLFAATALLSAACDDSTGIDDDEAANVRIVNASSVVGDLDVLVNGNVQTNASDIALQGRSRQCVRVDADNPQLTLQQSGGTVPLPTTNFTFDPGGRNTVIVSGTSAANLRVTTLSDALQPPLGSGEARIRVFNGRAITTGVDVYITPWNQPLGTPAGTLNTTTNVVTPWVEVPADVEVAVRVTPPNNPNAPVDIINVIPRDGEELVIVVIDPPTGGGLDWILSPACSAP
jgi:hypothetical protein